VPQAHKYATKSPLISFPCASALRSRMEPSPHLSEGSRNICVLKTKHLSGGLLTNGCMCESRPGSHSVFSNIRAPESDGNPLSSRNSNQMHVQPIPHLFFALFTAKIYQLFTALDSLQLPICSRHASYFELGSYQWADPYDNTLSIVENIGEPNPAPEPSTLLLLVAGIGFSLAFRKKRWQGIVLSALLIAIFTLSARAQGPDYSNVSDFLDGRRTLLAVDDLEALPSLAVDGSLAFVTDFESDSTLAGAKGKVHAKPGTYLVGSESGFLLKGQAFGGYIDTKNGKHLVYEVIVNNVKVNGLDDVLQAFQDEGAISAMLWRDN
jgi:PEP-CTERM motif